MNDQWWLMQPRPGLVLWARLRELEDGVAEILDSTGNTLRFDSEDGARHSLLTSDYVALDGLDADDALEMGLDVESLMPPEGKDERSLVHAMTQPTSN